MKYILDASIAVKWVLPETDSLAAIVVRDDFNRGIHELLAPDTLPVEVAHALTRAERKDLLLPGEAMSRLSRILLSLPVLHAYLPLLPRATEISSRVRIGIYDCLYVALAEKEQCELLTADQRLISALGAQYPIIALDAIT